MGDLILPSPVAQMRFRCMPFYCMRKFTKAIIFTNTPLKGFYKYKDLFQIYPANLNNIPSSKLQEHYPAILEYWTDDSEVITLDERFEEFKDFYSSVAVTLKKQDLILSLLSVISNHRFFRYTNTVGCWSMPVLNDNPSKEEANSWSAKWCLPLYNFPSMADQLKISAFSDITLDPVELITHNKYYTHNPNIDFDKEKEITFPSTVNQILDSYFELNLDIKETINSAISHSVSAMETRAIKRTLSLLCSFTAVETMINLEYSEAKIDNCKSCGQPKYSISRKFREYLLKYVATDVTNKKKFNSFYSLRSKIIHTGQRVKNETLFAEISKQEEATEVLTQIEILQLGKLSIINWLLLNSRK